MPGVKEIASYIYRKYCLVLLPLCILAFPSGIHAQFTEIAAGLTDVYYGSIAWGDYDNDGDLDVLQNGQTFGGICFSKVYRNDGYGVFTDVAAGLTGAWGGSVTWGDYDNDGDLDILQTGYSDNGRISQVYRNDGSGVFTDINAGLTGVGASSSAWGDYDNDGDLDILISGQASNPYVTKIYRNDGGGVFTDINADLLGVVSSSIDWGDYDNDGDLDILLTGFYDNNIYHYVSKVYRNDGNNIFTDINANLIGVCSGSAVWGDYDNDGVLDILLAGWADGNTLISKVYHNAGYNTFSDINADLPGVGSGSVAWGDYDNDGDLDILLTGYSSSGRISRIYHNDGNGTFVNINANLVGVDGSSFAWGDYDNDGDLDILLEGDTGSGYICKLYCNDNTTSNTVPSAPTNLRTIIVGNYVYFQWDASTDAQTPVTGLNYILRIGTTSGDGQITSPMASASGYRLIPVNGNVNSNCSWKMLLSALSENIYWSVQAIDGAFCGSAFSNESCFNVYLDINLMTPQALQFGNLPINDTSNWSEIIIQNRGLADLTISNLHIGVTDDQFNYSYVNFGNAIPPEEIDTILVRFAPMTVGAVNDTLYIESNALNIPVLKIRLSGTGISVPLSAPQNVNLLMQGTNNCDALLTWDTVTTNIHGSTITPDCYLVFNNGSSEPDGAYYFHSVTDTTQYIHYLVGAYAPNMFYRVRAYKSYGMGRDDLLLTSLTQDMTEADVMRILEQE